MSVVPDRTPPAAIEYPDSDGEPLAENTEQLDLIVFLYANINALVPDFVAGDLLWYPVEGRPDIRAAPDVLVARGRAKGRRGSYKQFEEGDIVPQFVVEIWSPGNRFADRVAKLRFYEKYGVLEFLAYDPDARDLSVWVRDAGGLSPVPTQEGWHSEHAGVTFRVGPEGLEAHGPDGPFTRKEEDLAAIREALAAARAERDRADAEQARADAEQARADAEQARADAEQARADAERERADRLVAKLKALGIEPEG